ncbi:hypothetical protein HR060_11370 [Catenovulum sp. SM1970]|uniref:hypothetical protein n=1 Tax=Marinifaba aquimaris TaxID=2741323 RepID=UPI001572DD3E|nr:hypothetical protein [Marinifaba aquimaris]NTS77461.1 hypothetical protein [Marinifaba aquimaris]
MASDLVAFLHALTDNCINDRECMAPWIIDSDDLATYPDGSAIIATDRQANEL